MYVAVIALAVRDSKVGILAGVGIGGLWAYINLFVTTFFMNGVHELAAWIHTGNLARPDQLIAVPAWGSNVLIVAGCSWAYLRRSDKRAGDPALFLITFIVSTAYFAADMALFQPRYLALFPRMLHPHLP